MNYSFISNRVKNEYYLDSKIFEYQKAPKNVYIWSHNGVTNKKKQKKFSLTLLLINTVLFLFFKIEGKMFFLDAQLLYNYMDFTNSLPTGRIPILSSIS